MRILSIDFDYFINVGAKERDIMFPDGADEINTIELKKMWEESYNNYPILSTIDLIPDINILRDYLVNLKRVNPSLPIYIKESHKAIGEIFYTNTNVNEVINIDFHHDYYHYFSDHEEFNCGNWLRRVVATHNIPNITWVRREDSQITSLEGDFPYNHTTDLKSVLTGEFDHIFICLSPEWTPPHLYKEFDNLINEIK